MPAFLHFVTPAPGATVPLEIAESIGLADRCPHGVETYPAPIELNRESGPGLICWNAGSMPAERKRIDHSKQAWLLAEEHGDFRLYAGLWLDWLPTEEDLRRGEALPVSDTVMMHGKPWMIPCLRSHDGDVCLPQSLRMIDGKLTRVPDRRFEHLDEVGAKLYQQRQVQRALLFEGCEAGTDEFYNETRRRLGEDFLGAEERYLAACEAIAANYRVGRAEIELLQLIDDRALLDIQSALLGVAQEARLAKLLDVEKKIRDAQSFANALAAVESGT